MGSFSSPPRRLGRKSAANQKRMELARPERRLALVEEHMQALSPELMTGVAILNAELRYVEVSDGLAKLHGLSPEEHWGKSIRDIIPQLAPMVEPLLRKIISTGEPAFNIELTGNLGGDPSVSHHLLISYIPLYGADNKPEGICALVAQATGRGARPGFERPAVSLPQREEIVNDKVKTLKDVASALTMAAEVLEEAGTNGLMLNQNIEDGIDFDEEVERFEISLIQRALKRTHGNQKRAARLLKMKHTTLHTKIKRYGITPSAIA
ncbi:MAG TPA: PAS domain-containing protein [Pyrinomonadaceae bacterium]|jgi:transcriptional regulator with PAS, ATPase and Fis domain